jgi:y4mF family transcriptional regulator
MTQPLDTTQALGNLVRRHRRAQGLTQTELAGACGVGLRFIVDLESGKPTCQIEKALRVVHMLGIRLVAEEPEALE